MPKPLMGQWDVAESLLKFLNADTAVLANEEHEGPVFKFPVRVPAPGEFVAIFHGFDVCKNRGEANHRPRVKIELRVKPARDGHNAEGQYLRITNSAEESGMYRRFWIDEGWWLYCDDGVAYAPCPNCGKRFPQDVAETHCGKSKI